MRTKNSPRRLIRQTNHVSCIDLIIGNHNWNQWRASPKSEKYDNYICENTHENGNAETCAPLDLSMSQLPPYHGECNNSPLPKINDLSVSTISDVAIDLSTKAININRASTRNLDYKLITPSTSQSTTEFKNLFLYKMLTDSTFIDNLKKLKHPNLISCEYCKKSFASQLDLYNHQNNLLDVSNNQISCCACGKIFSQRRYLRYHQRSHSEQSKFACEICTRKYSRMDNLTRHNTFHTNPDKFPCSFCERTFARKDLLNKHIKGHENKYRYHCDTCHKYFKGPLSLENHNKSYHPTMK